MSISNAVKSVFGEIDFDPIGLKEKYLSERDKRQRKDGTSQYIQVNAEFSRYVDDPYVEPGFTREPLTDEVEVVIIGGGFGGMLAAARLRESGFEDIRIIDKAGDFGGTWYWNRYPGAQCDVESYIYFPLLEETGYIPTQKYSYSSEIFEHSRRIAKHLDLYDNACLQTSVTGMVWHEEEQRWVIETDRDDRIKAQYVIMANGPLNRPKLPGIPGLEEFEGHTFHTSRWDYDYTGGDSNGNLNNLKDKRVGIIGTGATGVQCIPHLGKSAKELFVFQRTPSSIDIRNNSHTDPDWAEELAPGWQKRRMDNFNMLVSGVDQEKDFVGDGWTEIFRDVSVRVAKEASKKLGRRLTEQERDQLIELADFRKMNGIRKRADEIINDPATAEELKPWFRQFCKRPCFHDEYLETYNLPGVQLVDTKGLGVERVEANSVIVDGKSYEVDCLVFATGFEVGTAYTQRAGYDVIGREGVRLSEHWKDGILTHQGLQSNGFPNCFFMGVTQTAITLNIPHMLNEQAVHLAYILSNVRDSKGSVVEATTQGVQEYQAEMQKYSTVNDKYFAECTPGYYNGEGEKDGRNGLYANVYGAGPIQFFDMLTKWRDQGEMEGLDIR